MGSEASSHSFQLSEWKREQRWNRQQTRMSLAHVRDADAVLAARGDADRAPHACKLATTPSSASLASTPGGKRPTPSSYSHSFAESSAKGFFQVGSLDAADFHRKVRVCPSACTPCKARLL